jgi:biopolymer transport protein ExbD
MKFRRSARKKEPAVVDLTALLDAVFLLLLFFVVTTRFDDFRSLDVTLPEAAGAAAGQNFKGQVLDVAADGALRLDDSPVEEAGLGDALRSGAPVLLRADRGAAHGDVVRLLGVLQEAGAPGVEFEVVKPGASLAE